ncbi:MAG TPA: TPM domain-containing protein [Candidatus Gastranaerophilales bacterium]|nr:TPM domain-containing protein [Candidatus Gastranaerophilales bacterium]
MRKKTIYTAIIFVFILVTPVFAGFKIPQAVGYVNDFANVIADTEEAKLNSIILELKQKTQAEVVVVTLGSLEGYPVEDVSLEIGRQWKVGQKGKDNGVIILVAPNDREMRIETGYGVEGAIPDAKAGRIRDEYMIPNFKTGNYGMGILLGAAAIVDAIAVDSGVTISGNYNYQSYRANNVNRSSTQSNPLFNFFFIAIFLFFAIKYPRLTLFLLLSSGRGGGGHSGGFGGFSGGGGFGGGGASGRW